ncbi:DnaJ-domain-containing protein [Daedalea quercina L-15889]|uniref:DnaJ-domain-containing protein n=1 Tax=Daedalea quercina L-15889 TaxID=1314783 RepID=A0A165TI90_9APHY|nr:DnaJ-domain-containing protein [Daedalea quercina L-15889]
MFSYVLSSATSYFHLPIEEDEVDFPTSRHIAWTPSADSTDSDDSDSGTPSAPSTSAASSSRSKLKGNPKEKAIIQEILAQNDLYRILGVQRNSRMDKMALRRAYLARSKACHPDKFPDNPEATRAFQKVSVAYDVLSKPSSKRLYDSQPPQSYDIFASRPTTPAQDTFRSVVIGVFNDLLDGDLDMVRSLLRTVNDLNPALRLGEEGINSVLLSLQAIRERALTCRTCVLALHHELSHLLEVQRAFHDLSYFDIRRRSCLTVRLARLTVSLPIALERALSEQQADDLYDAERTRDGVGGADRTALLNTRVYGLLRGLVRVLERMEQILK